MTAPAAGAVGEGLLAHLRVDLYRFRLDLELALEPGVVLALLGPNGAGKSTALRGLAGLQPLTAGRIALNWEVLDDPAAGRFVPPDRRSVGMVFQDYLLFPHLTLRENVAFGPRARGMPKQAAHACADQWLDRVGLHDLAGARPHQVSGGQAQRVALARALATDPDLLVLDEPLAALDAGTRQQIRSDLRRHLAGYRGCTVLVSHDPLDAMVLADHLIVIEDGRMVQQGTPGDVARAPRTEYVARLVGLNLYSGRSVGTTVHVEGSGTLHTATPTHGQVFVAFRPSAVVLHREQPYGSARNAWPGQVAGLEHHGDTVRVRLDATPPVLADITAAAVADLRLGIGESVWAAVKATEIHSYPA